MSPKGVKGLEFPYQHEMDYKIQSWGARVAQSVKRLPSAQVVTPGSWDRFPHGAPCSVGSLLLSLPLPTAPLLVLSLSNK